MAFSITFLTLFSWSVYLLAPILIMLLIIVLMLGLIVGRMESWSRFNALYWALVTALTVGYGDIRPLKKPSKVLSIVIAWCGILLSGLLVAITVKAASIALEKHIDPTVIQRIEQQVN